MKDARPLFRRSLAICLALVLVSFAIAAVIWSRSTQPNGAVTQSLDTVVSNSASADPKHSEDLTRREAEIPARSVVRATTPASHDERPSFEVSENLFALASRGASSQDRQLLAHAASALNVCIDADVQQQRFGHLVNAAPADAATREKARAASVYLSRCRGFVDNDLEAVLSIRREVWARLRTDNSFAPGVSERQMTPQEFRAVVDARDWFAFEYGLNVVMEARGERGASTVGNALFALAYTAAACDLGKECGPDSITYAAHCLRSGDCAGSWERAFLKNLGEPERATVARYRAEIVRAVLDRNYAYFGL